MWSVRVLLRSRLSPSQQKWKCLLYPWCMVQVCITNQTDSDGASSIASGDSTEVWNDPGSFQEPEGVPTVPPQEILKFLQHTFRKRHVQIQDSFQDMHSFITSAKRLLLQSEQFGMTEPQMFRLRKWVLKARKLLLRP